MNLLNGRRFVMVSSTASSVNQEAPTQFDYSESDGLIWGSYSGDTVTLGRFVGTRDGAEISITYVHALKAGGTAGGQSSSRIETEADGRLRLVEEFQFDGDDVRHISICTEVLPA